MIEQSGLQAHTCRLALHILSVSFFIKIAGGKK
jgi:hypothetical protein